ncbi:hypothetical protein BSU04_23380 [Caballeronia sordidicola]|uniref:Uncharacterized protein n=1 Tax=Caballeronia sordidicola TaxID=196367 RepID=A0A226WSV7_CABSO|nr:hypothetical protein BSU04_32860 [Caballeronia sordidicola]OXC76139.1 hypothetical protein BSU04_23380 [Caballeronia sordidicola]
MTLHFAFVPQACSCLRAMAKESTIENQPCHCSEVNFGPHAYGVSHGRV